jgi:hypothetical protein
MVGFKTFARLAQDAKMRNMAALVVTVSSAVAFAFTRIEAHLTRQPKIPFIVRWGPDLFFLPAVLIVIAYVVSALRRPPPLIIIRQRFLTIFTSRTDQLSIDEANISIESHDEVFSVTVTGQIRGPELKRLMRYFDTKYDQASTPTGIPIQMLVSELTRTQGDFWWPQPIGTFNSDGSYTISGLLGSTGEYSARDGDLFELRLLIALKPQHFLSRGDQFESLDELPPYTFLSSPLVVRTKR